MSEQVLTDSPAAPALPGVPRPLHPAARRRSWAELPVRIWLVLSVALLIITVYFTVTRVREARQDRWLIQNGTPVNAIFTVVNGDPVAKRRPRNETMSAAAKFSLNGHDYVLDIPRLEAKPNAFAMVGQPLAIRVDPNEPTRWTEQTEPKPWVQELVTVMLLSPLCLLLLLLVWWKRSSMLRVYRHAPLAAATVEEVRHSSLAPRSRVIRFTLREGADRRFHDVLIPTSAGLPKKGDVIWLLCPPRSPSRAVLASLYAPRA